MKIKMSENAKASLDQMVARFQAGDISPIVKVAQIQIPPDAPSLKWSWANRIITFAQGGHVDCRGFQQWKEVGRHVRKREDDEPTLAVYITIPYTRTKEDEETGEEVKVLTGFGTAPVYPYTATLPMEGEPDALTYEPRELPPLGDVAERLGIQLTWSPAMGSELGSATTDGGKIRVAAHDAEPFFHELAHAIHARMNGGLEGGQDPHQETVAELTAVVLMELYGLGDRTGNAWAYIAHYNEDPMVAILKALVEVGAVLDFLFEEAD